MAVLTTQQRNNLPSSTFAGPHRSFPIPDKAHAIAAKRLIGRATDLTPEQRVHIIRMANDKLKSGK